MVHKLGSRSEVCVCGLRVRTSLVQLLVFLKRSPLWRLIVWLLLSAVTKRFSTTVTPRFMSTIHSELSLSHSFPQSSALCQCHTIFPSYEVTKYSFCCVWGFVHMLLSCEFSLWCVSVPLWTHTHTVTLWIKSNYASSGKNAKRNKTLRACADKVFCRG